MADVNVGERADASVEAHLRRELANGALSEAERAGVAQQLARLRTERQAAERAHTVEVQQRFGVHSVGGSTSQARLQLRERMAARAEARAEAQAAQEEETRAGAVPASKKGPTRASEPLPAAQRSPSPPAPRGGRVSAVHSSAVTKAGVDRDAEMADPPTADSSSPLPVSEHVPDENPRQRQIRVAVDQMYESGAVSALEVAQSIAQNALQSPDDKFRSLRAHNKKFQSTIGALDAGSAFLSALGFALREHLGDSRGPVWQLDKTREDPALLWFAQEVAGQALERRRVRRLHG